jgi:hypothetical protein
METQKIERFRFNGLKNAEFTLAVPHIVAIMGKYPCMGQLGKRFDAVKAFLPDLDRIEVQERKWSDAKIMDDAEHSRDGFVNTLIRTERTHARVVIPGYEEPSEKLTTLFDKHKRDIANDRNIAETQRIYNLVEDVERTPGMLDALAAFALIPVYGAMKEANIRFDILWQRRNAELGEADHVDSKAIRTDCVKAVNVLYDGIEYQATESDDPSWTKLIRELSQLGSYYKQQLKAGITRRKNRAQAGEKTVDEPLIQPPVGATDAF